MDRGQRTYVLGARGRGDCVMATFLNSIIEEVI